MAASTLRLSFLEPSSNKYFPQVNELYIFSIILDTLEVFIFFGHFLFAAWGMGHRIRAFRFYHEGQIGQQFWVFGFGF